MMDTLKKIINENTSIIEINIKNNNLGSGAIMELMSLISSKTDREINLITDGNFYEEEVMNSFTHGFGILLTIFGAVMMLQKVSHNYNGYHTFSCVVYLFSLFVLYTSSTLYHSFF